MHVAVNKNYRIETLFFQTEKYNFQKLGMQTMNGIAIFVCPYRILELNSVLGNIK